MSELVTCRVRLPRGLQSKVSLVTRQEGSTVNQFIALAIAEKLSTVEALKALRRRADRADMKSFRQILKRSSQAG
ncbi:MAG: toxin-antitoxin system HicB family antitoxin [Pseudomonadota bacterium]